MHDYMNANQQRWDELVSIHAESEFYDLASLRAGKTSLHSLELEELGDVAGKSLLHLQCHFGMDTLSWARLGARVMGADFSPPAIQFAQSLSRELGIEARFVCSNVYDLPHVLSEQFDIVFTSYGVLGWLPDIPAWARVVAHFLKPGGTFYIADGHPFKDIFDFDSSATSLQDVRMAYSYFGTQPVQSEVDGTYADRNAHVSHTTTYEWNHTLGEILTSLIAAGLKIEFLHEFPFSTWACLPGMEQGEDGWWHLKDRSIELPLTYSLKATKDTR